ncbi:MAG TPA: phosphate acyltransferase PlsX [Stenomitos sp.]
MTDVRIALDAMGGDYAPAEIVKGAVIALKADPALSLTLVGDEARIRAELAHHDVPSSRLSVVHASEVVEMDEAATAIRKKKDASIVVAMDQVKAGLCQGVVAAGSTGAAMAAALLRLGRIPGIERPAIAVVLPTLKGPAILLDVGANVDCKPQYLQQFAIMGSAYAQAVLKIDRPRVGLVNIGEEPGKGDELTLEAYKLLSETKAIHFSGNVEGRDLARGNADVAVADGFVGNVMLKFAEGLGELFTGLLKDEIMKSGLIGALGALLLRSTFRRFKRRLDYAEYGGALLLGVNGVCVISHGSSKAHAIVNAIRVSKEAILAKTLERIAEPIAALSTSAPQ